MTTSGEKLQAIGYLIVMYYCVYCKTWGDSTCEFCGGKGLGYLDADLVRDILHEEDVDPSRFHPAWERRL